MVFGKQLVKKTLVLPCSEEESLLSFSVVVMMAQSQEGALASSLASITLLEVEAIALLHTTHYVHIIYTLWARKFKKSPGEKNS